ncbi:head-tail adaptor protein [Pseudoalteromonas sp. S16_S37]|uniref:head-tail adaptor protein n=1 Tax=Pseudoalteromonas sp. S16_S37 TaxID=2720228 RepID=UPI001680A073|nr:head-tail adaptor protein [Pseudoalteromonas sp. S16_S37]MBD1583496.1 head-tail adaptor protein [Pseudoalteromonas sp. S16_S37]
MSRLKPSQKRHRATLYETVKVSGPRGDKTEMQSLAEVRGSFKKQRGGLVNRETLEISTAQASFACDYRSAFLNISHIKVSGIEYKVTDVTNVGLNNHTLIFDIELNR